MSKKLVEYTIEDIIDAIDDFIYHHRQHTRFYRNNSQYYFIGIKDFTYYFAVKASGEYEKTKHNIYIAKIELPQLNIVYTRDIKNIRKKTYLKRVYLKVLSVIENGDVKVSCSCPAFKYLGYDYISSSIDSKSGTKEDRYPKIKNPELGGIVCKHLDVILKDFKKESIYKKYVDVMFDWMFNEKLKNPKIKWWRVIINNYINFDKIKNNLKGV